MRHMMMNRPRIRLGLRLPMPDGDESGGGSPPPPPPPPGPAAPEWAKDYPDDVKSYVVKNAYPDPLAAIKSNMNLEKLVGVPADQLIRRPGQDFATDPKSHLAALDVLGRPKEPKAYGEAGIFAPVDGLGALDEKAQGAVSSKFHELGILPWQAKGLMDMFTGLSKEQKAAMDANSAAAETERNGRLDAYKAERGAKYQADVEGARSVIAKFDRPISGEAEALKAAGQLRVDDKGVILQDKDGKPVPQGRLENFLNRTGLHSDPDMIAFLSAISERFGPSTLTGDDGRPLDQVGAMSKEQALQKERELRGDKNFMQQFTSRNDAGHKEAVEQMNKVMKIAYG